MLYVLCAHFFQQRVSQVCSRYFHSDTNGRRYSQAARNGILYVLDGVRSLGRLFAHAQSLRRKLEAFEECFQKTWLTLPIEEVNRVSYLLAFVRDALHTSRRHTMIFIALAMPFVHDEDGFLSYCRAQEDRIAREADVLYMIQDKLREFAMMLLNFTSDFSAEQRKRISSLLPTDPIEVRMFDMRTREWYEIVLVHDGTENCIELAIGLQSEIQNRSFLCYMENVERLRNDGDVMSDQTERTLDCARVGVFLLTPEFAKTKRKVAQLRHMIGRVRNARIGWPGPTIIPVFFMVSIEDCRSGAIFGEACEAGDVDKDAAKKASHYDTRYTRMADCLNDTIAGEASKDADVDKDAAKKAFHYVTRYTGIENHDGAKVSENEEMDDRCMRVVRRTADAVEEVCITNFKEYSEQTKRTGSGEESEDQKEQSKILSDVVLTLRRSQREAREKAILNGERDPFRTV